MPSPIHIAWRNRPGVGEYGARRVHGGHDGFDTYTLPLATIYGTANGGVVIGKGYVEGGWGHYIDVCYPNYSQRDCHLAEASGLRKGDPVGTGTALGRVGQTGNAKGIRWWHAWFKAWLWHVHSEVYLARTVDFKKRTNPLPVWGVTTAGADAIPLPPPPPPKEEDDMNFRYFSRTNPTTKRPEYAITHPLIFPNGVFITPDITIADGFAPYTGNSSALTDARWAGMLKTAKIAYDAAWATEERKAKLAGTAEFDYAKVNAQMEDMVNSAVAASVERILARIDQIPTNYQVTPAE